MSGTRTVVLSPWVPIANDPSARQKGVQGIPYFTPQVRPVAAFEPREGSTASHDTREGAVDRPCAWSPARETSGDRHDRQPRAGLLHARDPRGGCGGSGSGGPG